MPAFSRPTDARSPCGGATTKRLGFACQVAFVRVLGRLPQQAPLEIDGEIDVATHSGRRGLASELVRRGASTTAIQAASGFRPRRASPGATGGIGAVSVPN